MPQPVRLRPHHLICLQFYRGEGYDPAFVTNLDDVLARLREERALIVSGADDVCRACPGLASDGTCDDPHAGEAEIARIDALALEVLGLAVGQRISLAQAYELLEGDAVGVGRWRFDACHGCTWEDVCESGWKQLLR